MATPSISDITLFTDYPLNQVDWSDNWNQTVSWLTDGNADVTVGSITAIFKLKPLTTYEITSLVSPVAGTFVYNSDINRPMFYDGTGWQAL